MKISIKKISIAGIMAAMVFATSWMRIPPGNSEFVLHLGNVMCILSGLVLGGFLGGCSAGIGSFLFDLTNPAYISDAPFTLVFKFIMAFTAGKIAHANGKEGLDVRRNAVAATAGQIAYLVLYLTKKWFYDYLLVDGLDVSAAMVKFIPKATSSAINGVIAVIAAVPLAFVIRAAMKKANVDINR